MMRRFLLFAIFLFPLAGIQAQIYQPSRFEYELEDGDEDFLIINAEEEGLFLSRKVENKETKRDFKYQLIRLDTNLNVVFDNYYYENLEYRLTGYDFIDPYIYFLYRHSYKSKKYKIVRFDKETLAREDFELDLDFELELTEFEVIDETLVFGGYINNRPGFVCFKFNDPKPIVLPGFLNDPSTILQLEMEEEKGTFNVLLSYLTQDKRRSIAVKTYNTEGKLIKDFNLQPQGNNGLLYGRSVSLNDEEQLVVGTYTYKNSDMSRGVFVAKIEDNGSHIINYYNYADLKNFFNYMKAKREIRVKKRIERRKIKGKKNKFHYKLLVHDIINYKNQFIMVGEAFYPKYSYGSPSYSSYGYGRYGSGTFFEGYAYTHAVVIGFDQNGKIIWDNSFEIEDVISLYLDHFVHVVPTSDGINLLYVYENEIRSKIVKGTQVLDVKEQAQLKSSFDENKINVESSDYGGLNNWYDSHLYAFGVQKIKATLESNLSGSKEIFFINKLSAK